ncbi:helix-turn-helix domain-containing protein [Rhizobium sp. XQZ8]|uniref:helix-turn-helix domain-containing protein n=1 Tax=Rhizobium populisoli TaxID=2859785 RepID=UPI001C6849EC|nr:helix-turn-helix transcriptional regulator [Rhizobium populisoli]MBW6420788.1 helix-turn-helix domain-containing protein [Rhizobium populisoli]
MTISMNDFASANGAKLSPQPIAAAVSEARRAVGYSVEDLAVTTGLINDEILRIENGTDADPAKLKRIASALKVPVSKFLTS